jgi:predicted MFS family arabinose efflux permease
MATETAIAQAYITDITGEDERAKGLGRIGAAFGAGIIVGPAIGGFLSVYGFWAPGLAATALTLINYFFVLFFLPESDVYKKPRKETPKSNNDNSSKWFEVFKKPIIGSVLIIFFIVVLAFSTIPVTLPLLGIQYFNLTAIEMSYIFMYIGIIQIVLQGFLIGRLTDKVGEEKLVVYGPLLMTAGMFVIPLISEFPVFLASMTIISLGIGIMQTAIPSFISKRTSKKEQGAMLGITQSTASIARVPGPLLGGFIFEYIGLAAPFFLSAALLTGASGLGCRVFQKCFHRKLKNI